MKKLLIAFICIFLALPNLQAQQAAKSDSSMKAIYAKLNKLLGSKEEGAKEELARLAKSLAKSKNEDRMGLAVRVYEMTGQKENAGKVEKEILKKFPAGAKARSIAFKNLFDKEGPSPAAIDKGYEEWLKRFPDNNPDKVTISLYDEALTRLLVLHGKAGNKERVAYYLGKAATATHFYHIASRAASSLMEAKQWDMARTILEDGFRNVQETTVTDKNKKENDFYKNRFAGMLGQSLFELGETDRSVELLQMAMQGNQPFADQQYDNLMVLCQGLMKQGKSLDAFLLLQQYVLANNNNEAITARLKTLYTELNKGKGDFAGYLQSLNAQVKVAKEREFKEKMIKEEAPLFSMKDIDGNTVSLAQLKGKVVVLDFWATWCGPCKISFPGMQAAVTKYKDDKEVVFLFIDVWEREKNYKEMVAKFIAGNKYDFHVLFDEMENRDRSTAKAYGVTGIPTQVVIDKNGLIRFKSAGGESNVEKLVAEMETKIELTKKG
ncbi:TlpA disulfide reductase family protein [Pseudoflavitalea rhizosphaerae]|uniref:TlpA disulfide reductase family protein n=1 Tax=Pseudoflavitalea rhizosphaerae TaxID=1884793 RepID=UPI000F8E472E|nr:TlpA disulfide reductase family protein [Pseudoflavitalea rhizosphaerae]